ncbi:hypothetical protein VaNZ11_006678 [Volvox africanus]|uniref:Uncharacterized protein n=1 Tax=Volvox africanus TaxID=51714 RepID=A0ABQ5S214_9CHLO|nr:hypothetical protein VaNZ11_006678 [Volvox africanus]
MEQALRFLNAMVNAKGSEGLLPRSTGGTGGGGSWGNAGDGAASSAGGTTAGGSGGGGGSRNKIITVPAHVLAPAKGKGGKAGGGGGSPPTPPAGSSVSTEAAAKADVVCREGQWQAHQHKTCRLHVLARTPHTQAACKVSASRISTDPQGLFRDMCRKLQEAQQAGQVPRDLSGSVVQAQQFLARAAAPSMTVTIEQVQLQRIEDTLQSVLAMQQLPSSAVSEVAAPVQPAALAWRPPAPPVPLAAPSIAPSHVTATGVHAGPPAAVYRPTHTPVQSPLMPPPPPHTHPPWQPGTWPLNAVAPTGSSAPGDAAVMPAPAIPMPFAGYSVFPIGATVGERMPMGFPQLPRAAVAGAAEVAHALRPPTPPGAGDATAVATIPDPRSELRPDNSRLAVGDPCWPALLSPQGAAFSRAAVAVCLTGGHSGLTLKCSGPPVRGCPTAVPSAELSRGGTAGGRAATIAGVGGHWQRSGPCCGSSRAAA